MYPFKKHNLLKNLDKNIPDNQLLDNLNTRHVYQIQTSLTCLELNRLIVIGLQFLNGEIIQESIQLINIYFLQKTFEKLLQIILRYYIIKARKADP